MKTAINPTRSENYPLWYQAVITEADLAQLSAVRGCMIITPWGYALWERIQKTLNQAIKETGHDNIYCPLFIPLSHIEKEAQHVEGFAKECAVVTHSKLSADTNGQLQPGGKLDEPLIIRPTSEMVIGEYFSQRIQSHRDLPVLINQWANVVRWEMRTRMFLRTTEFLWQEGHTAHAHAEEAVAHTQKMLECYRTLCEETLAIPVICGEKTINEKFPGAEHTLTIEGVMQDGKALQLGTSHNLGQTFSKSCNIQFQNANKQLQYVHTTSWGVTTRLIGAVIMTHGDDNGLICPPTLAPHQVVIIPFSKKACDDDGLQQYCAEIKTTLEKVLFRGVPLRVHIDNRAKTSSEKKWSWIKKGVPIRLEIGMRELTEQRICAILRTHLFEKHNVSLQEFSHTISEQLSQVQAHLFEQAQTRLSTTQCPLLVDKSMLHAHFSVNNPGPALIYWGDNDDEENQLQSQYKVSLRCYPNPEHFSYPRSGPCLFDNTKPGRLALIAKAY